MPSPAAMCFGNDTVSTAPTPTLPSSNEGWFTDSFDGGNGTVVDEYWFNKVGGEISNAIQFDGTVLNMDAFNQIAIKLGLIPQIQDGVSAAGAGGASNGGAIVTFPTAFAGVPSVKLQPITNTSPLQGSTQIAVWTINISSITETGFVAWGAYWSGGNMVNCTNQEFYWEATYVP
jgi:hypothetical protein